MTTTVTEEWFLESLTLPEQCSICYEDWSLANEHKPIRLACGHWICRECLLTHMEVSPSRETCPTCRSEMFARRPSQDDRYYELLLENLVETWNSIRGMNGNTVHQDFYNHTVEILGAIQEKVRVELGGHEGTDWNVIELFLNLLMSIDLADDHTGFCDLIIFTMAISPSMVMLRRLPDESANLWWRFAIMFHNDEYQISTAGHFVVMHEAMTLKYCPQIFYEWKHWTRKALWSIVKSEVTKVSQPRADTMRYDPAVLFTFRKMTAVLSKLEGLQGFTNESPTFVGREEELTEVRRLLGSKELTDKQLSDYQRYCHRILKDLRDKSASVTLESILR